MRLQMLLVAACALAFVALATGAPADAREAIDPGDFSATITNPYFPLSQLGSKIFEGEDTDPESGDTIPTRLESTVLPDTIVVGGVTVTVLEEKAYEDGELVEVAYDYFAQHTNGDVYYFGERVDNYEDGELKDHAGQWLHGEDGATAGIYIGANPAVGVTYEQELAPGIAEDKSEVLAIGESVTVPAGTYNDCVRTRDYTPLEPGINETKWHCRGAGLVKETGADSVNELASIGAAPASVPSSTPAASAPTAVAPTGNVTAPDAGTGGDDRDVIEYWIAVIGAVGVVFSLGGVRMLFRERSS
jgi:hypothetical protein